MAYNTDFQCTKCNFVEEVLFKSYEVFKIQENNMKCPKCKEKMERVWISAPSIEVKETQDIESAKPSSYWRNAEKIKQEKIRKKKEAEAEKIHYKDPETMKKIENKKRNAKAFESED